MQKLIITKGLPGSGKTTWSLDYIKNNSNTVRVNRDSIRNMLLKEWPHGDKSLENLVTFIEDKSVIGALARGYDVIVDATNFRGHERFIPLMPKEADIELIIQEMDITLEECIKRDAWRTEGHVGKEVIEKMYKQYIDK
jgi:tRNA uridine 5-carbamoylmethylation protein Kti12